MLFFGAYFNGIILTFHNSIQCKYEKRAWFYGSLRQKQQYWPSKLYVGVLDLMYYHVHPQILRPSAALAFAALVNQGRKMSISWEILSVVENATYMPNQAKQERKGFHSMISRSFIKLISRNQLYQINFIKSISTNRFHQFSEPSTNL